MLWNKQSLAELNCMKNAVKRALLTSNTNLTDTDGKSLRVLSIAELLNKTGFDVTLLVSECNSSKAKDFSVIETKSHVRNTLSDSFMKKVLHFSRQFIVLISFYAKLLVSGENYDVIGSTLVGPEIDSLFASILSKIKKVPFVYDYDDPSPEIRELFYGQGKNDLRVKLSSFSRNIMVRSADLVLASADTTKRQLLRYSRTATKVCVFYNLPKITDLGVHANKNVLRKKLGLSSKFFIVSYLGNLPNWSIEEIKNTLLCCAKNLEPDPHAVFVIIGGGEWEQYYQKEFEEMGLADHILITGRQPRQVALDYFVASDVSMIPFKLNNVTMNIVPTKLFEAMALGIPVLCTKSSNYLKILGDDGIYFDGSCSGLTEKIKYCMMNPEKLGELSSNLKSKFASEYNLEKTHLSLGKVLSKLL